MNNIIATTGNLAVAKAMQQIEPDVCAAYPITPSTEIMQQFASYVADGEVNTNLVTVESEHSAMSACIGASVAGSRVMTVTSACGLALMWEMLYVASSLRLPIVLGLVNRALSGNINIHCDHSDSMGTRDAGWIQLYSENAQEAYDNMFQAIKIAEAARLPVMVCFDGFIISHSIERIELLDNKQVRKFIGEYKPHRTILDLDNPKTYGPLDLQDYYIEHKYSEHLAFKDATKIVNDVSKDFSKTFKRDYGIFEKYELDDAEIGIVVLSSAAGTLKYVIDDYRKKGVKVGLLRPRVFRPFISDEYREALKHLKTILVLDRSDTFGGFGGPLFNEFRSCLYELDKKPYVFNRIFGLGGREFGLEDARAAIEMLIKTNKNGKIDNQVDYLGVRR